MKLPFNSKSVLVSLFSILVGTLCSYSQAQETYLAPVSFPLKDLSNNKAEVTYTHQKARYGKTRTIYKTTAILEIKSKNDEGFIASWTNKSTRIGDVLIDVNSPKASDALIGVPIEFTMMRQDGSPIKLLDKDKFFELLINTPAYAGEEAEKVESKINFLKSMDDQWIVNTFLKVPSFMSVCQGESFKESEINNYPVEYPNPFGEGVILGNTSIELTSLDIDNNIAHIETLTKVDTDSLKQVIKPFVENHANGDRLKEALGQFTDRKDGTNCEIDLSTGWVRRVKVSTLISAYGESVEDIYDISLNWMK